MATRGPAQRPLSSGSVMGLQHHGLHTGILGISEFGGGGSLSPKSFVSGPLHTSAPSAGGVLDGSLNLGVGGLARGVWTREAAVLGGRCCPLVMHPKVTGKPWERRE